MLGRMIQTITTHKCSRCGSTNIVKNGHNKCGNQQYRCNDCKAHRVLDPKTKYSKTEKKIALRTYKERASMRGLERIFLIARQTVARWIIELMGTLSDLKETLLPAKPNDGFGRRCVVAPVRLWHLSSVIAAKTLVCVCGARFLKNIDIVTHSVTSGICTRRLSLSSSYGTGYG